MFGGLRDLALAGYLFASGRQDLLLALVVVTHGVDQLLVVFGMDVESASRHISTSLLLLYLNSLLLKLTLTKFVQSRCDALLLLLVSRLLLISMASVTFV